MDQDILHIVERIEIATQLGESHFREFKSSYEGQPNKKKPRDIRDICIDIAQTLVAFANADGGELFVGVEDDGLATGIDYSDEQIDSLKKAPITHIHKDTPLPIPRVSTLSFQGKKILYFSVSKGTDFVYLTSDGRCLQRKDRESTPISSEQIRFSKSEIDSREYDRIFINNADISDLDTVLISKVAEHIAKGISIEKCLQHLELAEYDGEKFRLRRAALLLFAKEPNKWHPRQQVRVLKIDGTELLSGDQFNVSVDNEETGNTLDLIEKSWDLLRPHLTETRFSKEARFMSQIMYPELACREALVNAIAHRDYSNEGRGIEVCIFSDRLEIASPGGLLSSLNIEDLRNLTGVHQSRNSLVSRVLKEVGYMRELGEGMRRIYELMKSNDLTPPDLYSDHNGFVVILHHKYIYSKEQKLWLEGFDRFELSREQKTIVLLGYNMHIISPKEIWGAVGIVDTDYYRQLLESLRNLGILSRSVPKARAITIARKRHIPVKQVPQFSVRLTSTSPLPLKRTEFDDDADYSKLYVVNIPYTIKEEDLIDIFKRYGTIADVSIPINRYTGLARGFAFVEFEYQKDAQRALGSSGKISLEGRTLYMQKAENKA